MLGHHHLFQLFVVPLIHRIFSGGLAEQLIHTQNCNALRTLHLLFSRIFVQVSLLDLSAYVKVMTEFALGSLFTIPRLEECTQHCLRVHTKRHLLHLRGLQECCLLLLTLLLL